MYSVHGFIFLQCADLHIFHQVFRALHQNYSLEWRMLAYDSTYPVHSYNKLRDAGFTDGTDSLFVEDRRASNVVLPALTCRTSGLPHSSHGRRRAASAGPCLYQWAPGHWAHPDTPHTGSSRSEQESHCWFDLDGRRKKMRFVLDYPHPQKWFMVDQDFQN